MTTKERLNEVNFIMDCIQQLKMNAVKEQMFEKAAYLRGKEREYLDEKSLLEEEL